MRFDTILDATTSLDYALKGYWRDRSLYDIFKENVARAPDKLALVAGEVRWTYAEVESRVAHLAANFAHMGLGPGDIISAQLPNRSEFLLVLLAATRLGAVTNGLLPLYRQKDLAHILGKARTKIAIFPDRVREFEYCEMYRTLRDDLPELEHLVVADASCPGDMVRFEELVTDQGAPEPPAYVCNGNDVTTLIFTSGTESTPKGVMHSHNTMLFGNLAAAELMDIRDDIVVWAASPITHATGIQWNLRMAIVFGGTLVMQEKWDPDEALALIERERCTFTCGATPFATMLLDAPTLPTRNLTSFRIFLCGGAAVPASLGRAVREKIGCDLIPCWGMSECFAASMGAIRDPDHKRWGTDGRALPGAEIDIFDDDREVRLPAGQVGEIATRGPHVCLGYFDDPERTRDTFRDSWLFSGDLGMLDADGFLRVVGRKKDIINRGGLKISAAEVEQLIMQHEDVRSAALIGVPDPKMGEKSCVFIVPRPGATPTLTDITAFMEARGSAKFKLPEYMRLVGELPMTPTGRVQKFMLKVMFQEAPLHV